MNEHSGIREVFFGLEEYLKFCGNNDEDVYLTTEIGKAFGTDNMEEALLACYVRIISNRNPNDKIFRGINNYLKENKEDTAIQDAMSRSQMRSKIWLVEELEKINTNYANVLVMAGWFGQIKTIYDKRLTYSKMRIVELDKSACETSDYIFNIANLENYKVKAVNVLTN